jgi:hypothetical protein
MGIEQRKCSRFLVKENAFIALQNGHTRVGNISNISKSGSSFEYIIDRDSEEHDDYMLDIYVFEDQFRLDNVPCNIVYDSSANQYIESSYVSFLITNRCGVQFGELSDDQLKQLTYFLENYTTGLAP